MAAERQPDVRLVLEDDLDRNRLTVFFRLLLAIPHLIWILLWTIAIVFAAIANWVATLAAGTPPPSLHRFMCSYIRYSVHLNAYLYLVGNPYPGFVGEEGEYPVDVRLPGPAPQPRWQTLIRILLALPALLLSSALGGAGGPARVPGRGRVGGISAGEGALAFACAFLGWFAVLARGRMPRGLRDAAAYAVAYNARTLAYVLLVTDRYPDSDPTALLEDVERPPLHPVHLVGDARDLRRSRLTVFFRPLLALPHLVWLVLWSVAALVAAIGSWFATLVRGTPPAALHRFLCRYLRYALHVSAFLYLAANPFPGFTGRRHSYPLDLELPPPERQSRWVVAFRIVLWIPAWLVNAALGWALLLAAVFTWFVALVRGAAPWGLRNLMAYALRYEAQAYAYLFLVTDRYPHASPLEGSAPVQLALDDEP